MNYYKLIFNMLKYTRINSYCEGVKRSFKAQVKERITKFLTTF